MLAPFKLQLRPENAPLDTARQATLRARIADEARSWVGTPYRQLGATKGIAVDCCMLIVRVMIGAGVIDEFDPRPYPPLWFFHRDDERYMDWFDLNGVETDSPQTGDCVTWRYGRAYSHSGIMISPTHVVHAFADEGACLISPLHHTKLLYIGHAGALRPRKFFDVLQRLSEV